MNGRTDDRPDPSRVIASLARDRVNLDLKTVDLCFLAGLYLKAGSTFQPPENAIAHDHFPEVDLMLRRGRHIGRDDGTLYEYLVDAQAILEKFYERFGCGLVQRSDGYFFLLPSGDQLGRRHLSAGEVFFFGDPKGFPSESKEAIEDMVSAKRFYVDDKPTVGAYEKFMKMAGPYWMSCVTKDDNLPILDPDHYLTYLDAT